MDNTKKPITKKWWFWVIIIVIVIIIVQESNSSPKKTTESKTTSANTTQVDKSKSKNTQNTAKAKPAAPVKQRQVAGKAVDLGAGTFQGGKDVQAGLYDVTPADGQGNFTVKSSDDLKVNEVLGSADNLGVSKVRVKIADGDAIQLESINKTHFEPVTTPFITSVQAVNIYSGDWTVGEDIAPGRYVVTTPSGGGNFIVMESGMPVTNEILGDNGVKNITVNLKSGDIVQVGNLNQVTLTPSN